MCRAEGKKSDRACEPPWEAETACPAHHTTFCSLPYTHLARLTRSRPGSCARNLLCESLRRPCFHDEFSDASDQHLGAIVVVPALVLIVIGESRNNNRSILGID